MKRLLYGLIFAALAHPACADGGKLSAYACGEFVAGHALDVEVDDDSEQMEKIQNAVIEALRQKKTEVSEQATWVLGIGFDAIREGVRRKKRDLGSVNDGSSEQINARMNVWSNRKDSIVGGRKDTIVAGPIDQIHVTLTVNDKSNGKCVWRGEAVHDTTGLDQWAVAEKSILRLIGRMGQEVRDQEFEVDP